MSGKEKKNPIIRCFTGGIQWASQKFIRQSFAPIEAVAFPAQSLMRDETACAETTNGLT